MGRMKKKAGIVGISDRINGIAKADRRAGIRLAAFLSVALMALTGCGKPWLWGKVQENTLVVEKDGAVTLCLVDSFEKEYYSIPELLEFAEAEADAYNRGHPCGSDEDAVTVESVEFIGDEKAKVLLRESFDSADTYEAFEGGILFTGTVGEALDMGFDLEQRLHSAKDRCELPEEWHLQNKAQKILITDLKGKVYVPGRVWALSQGECLAGGAVDTMGTQGNVLLLLK